MTKQPISEILALIEGHIINIIHDEDETELKALMNEILGRIQFAKNKYKQREEDEKLQRQPGIED
ncbi:MAG: hypothetical protein ACE5HI_01990 [bacterium]